jgi:hypothetical protein
MEFRAFAIAVAAAALGTLGHAQELSPYSSPRVTEAQWQSYYNDVRVKYGASGREVPNQPLIVFDDGSKTQWAFTQPGHPAHPSWITRQVVSDGKGVSVRQVGFFAGDERAFAALFQAYAALNQQAAPKPEPVK